MRMLFLFLLGWLYRKEDLTFTEAPALLPPEVAPPTAEQEMEYEREVDEANAMPITDEDDFVRFSSLLDILK